MEGQPMAKITIGEVEYFVPELNFYALERAWPFIETAMVSEGLDPMQGPNAALRIIAAGIVEDENFQPETFNVTAKADNPDAIYEEVVLFLRKKLKARQIHSLKACIDTIIEEAGLMGEADASDTVGNVETLNHSQETVAAS